MKTLKRFVSAAFGSKPAIILLLWAGLLAGAVAGYSAGYSAGEDNGKMAGREAGYVDGFADGRADGKETVDNIVRQLTDVTRSASDAAAQLRGDVPMVDDRGATPVADAPLWGENSFK